MRGFFSFQYTIINNINLFYNFPLRTIAILSSRATLSILRIFLCPRIEWLEHIVSVLSVWFRSGVLRGIWINASAHKTWRHLYFFLICFPYQVIYQKTCQILGFLNIHELGISYNTNLNKIGKIHDIWDNFLPQNVLF